MTNSWSCQPDDGRCPGAFSVGCDSDGSNSCEQSSSSTSGTTQSPHRLWDENLNISNYLENTINVIIIVWLLEVPSTSDPGSGGSSLGRAAACLLFTLALATLN